MTEQGAKAALEKIADGLEKHEAHPAMKSGIGDFFLTAGKFREVVGELQAKGWDHNTILVNVGLIFQMILKYGPDILAIITSILAVV